MPQHPGSVPINLLVKVKGTPLENADNIDPFIFVRTVAVARIMMPKSYVRLSAGRESMDEATQALCFFAGANSVFFGEKLLTTPNVQSENDMNLLARLNLRPQTSSTPLTQETDRGEPISGHVERAVGAE